MRILVLILPLLLGACDTINVLGSCPIPAALDYEAKGPRELPKRAHSPDEILLDTAVQRKSVRSLANDYNDLRGFVKEKCQ